MADYTPPPNELNKTRDYAPTTRQAPTNDTKFTTFATVCVVGIIAALLFAMFLVYMKRT